MKKTKQVIIVRKDLKMPAGKLGAQVAHASLKAVIDYYFDFTDALKLREVPVPVEVWLDADKSPFFKVVLKVDSLDELKDIYMKVNGPEYTHIPHAMICDAGHTVFNEPTITCISIGPWWADEIDELTGHLKLY